LQNSFATEPGNRAWNFEKYKSQIPRSFREKEPFSKGATLRSQKRPVISGRGQYRHYLKNAYQVVVEGVADTK